MFKSNARFSNFAQAGKSVADDTVRAFAASRRNAPKYDEMAITSREIRSKEKIAAMKAEMEVAKAGIKAQTDVKTNQIEIDAEAKLGKAKRKAGALAAAGQLFAEGGQYLWERSARSVKLVQKIVGMTLRLKLRMIALPNLPKYYKAVLITDSQTTP